MKNLFYFLGKFLFMPDIRKYSIVNKTPVMDIKILK